MRSKLFRLILTMALLTAAGAPQVSFSEVPFVKEEIKVQMPYGESAFTLWHNTRTPHEFNQPTLVFSDGPAAAAADTRLAETLATHGAWVILLDEEELKARFSSEAEFGAALPPLAEAIKAKMSEAMGPRLRGMPPRKWPMTFAGRGTGAVRAALAAIKYDGGVKGLILTSPAVKASAFGKDEAPLVLMDLAPKLGVTPVAILAPAENESLHALSEAVPGYSAIKKTPGEGLSYVSMHYQIRHKKAPGKGSAPAFNPADLFRPGA